MVVIKQSSA